MGRHLSQISVRYSGFMGRDGTVEGRGGPIFGTAFQCRIGAAIDSGGQPNMLRARMMNLQDIRRVAILVLGALALGAAACRFPQRPPGASPTPGTHTPTAAQAASAALSEASATPPFVLIVSPTLESGECGSGDRTRYDLDVIFEYASQRLQVRESISYFNASPDSLESLVLVVEANRRQGVFSLGEVRLADGEAAAPFVLDDARLEILLHEPLLPGHTLHLALTYSLDIPPRHAPLGYTPLQTNLGDWYPFVTAYDPERSWIVHDPAPVGESLVEESADFAVHIEVVDPPEGLTIAASGAEAAIANGEYLLCAARSFAWSASTFYETLSTTAGEAEVNLYVLAGDVAAGPSALSAAAGSVEAFSSLFAPYPHRSLAVVQADFSDGMEYDGLVFIGGEFFGDYPDSPANYLTTLTAHEVAHQWWYGLAGNDPAAEPWLDEALATYSELVFYERAHPELRDWWWDFRVERFDPHGWVDSTSYELGAFRPYVNAVYLRGALFLEEIRRAMGDEGFFAFLQSYLATGAHRVNTAEDLFEAMDPWGGEELSVIRARYFRSIP